MDGLLLGQCFGILLLYDCEEFEVNGMPVPIMLSLDCVSMNSTLSLKCAHSFCSSPIDNILYKWCTMITLDAQMMHHLNVAHVAHVTM